MVSGSVLSAMAKMVVAVPPLLGHRLEPGFRPLNDPANNALQDALEAAIDHTRGAPDRTLEPHAFAVVDLTLDPSRPVYAGWRDTEQRFIASLAKLLALFAAYRLRADLRQWSADLGNTNLAVLAFMMRDEYRRHSAATATRPRIEKMFDPPTAVGAVNFTRGPENDFALDNKHADTTATDAAGNLTCPEWPLRLNRTFRQLGVDLKVDFELADLTFREHLRLMAGWSDNVSAGVVIESLGFPFLWAVANRSGLFRSSWDRLTRRDPGPSGKGGLFLARDFRGTLWATRPTEAPPSRGSNQAGTARSVATLMTLLGQDALIDREASVGMREMLRKSPDFTGRGSMFGVKCSEFSPIGLGPPTTSHPLGSGLAGAGWSAAQTAWTFDTLPFPPVAQLNASKIGLLTIPPIHASNALLIRAPRSSTVTITAVLVALNNVNDDTTPLHEFGFRMAKQLDQLHGGP